MMLNGFKIEQEILVKDKYIYEIIVFIKGFEKLSKKEIMYGKCFIHDDLYKEYFSKKLDILTSIRNNLPKNHFIKRIELTKKIRRLKNII